MNIGIYSYAHSSLNDEIAFYQKLVFDKFSISIKQIISDDNHPTILEKIICDSTEDYLIFFDIDCIPLDRIFFEKISNDIKSDCTLSGVIQCANHIDKYRTYVGASFVGFSKVLYTACGNPSMFNWDEGDVMQRFTDECEKLKEELMVNVKYWFPTNSGDNCWNIEKYNMKYGHGTIYDDIIYHQFEIRNELQHDGFIRKCKEVLC